MAKFAGYFDDNPDVDYSEGPFVVVYVNGFRIECKHPSANWPVLPDNHIYAIMRGLGLDGKTENKNLAIRVCDTLNTMVTEKRLDPWL